MSNVERGTNKSMYLSGGGKRTNFDQKSGLPPLQSNAKLKRLFILSGGKKLEAEHIIVPGSDVEELTLVHELNPRNQDAVDDLSTRELLPKIKERGVDSEAIAVLRNGIYYLVEGSRRRFCCIKCKADLPLWVFNEELSDSDISSIYNAAQTSKKFSYREMGFKYKEIIDREELKTNEELAKYLGIGLESVRRRIQAANIDHELIKVFPDCEGIPNSFYSKLANIQKRATANSIPIDKITSEILFDKHYYNQNTNLEETQRSILIGLQSILKDLTPDSSDSNPAWVSSDIVTFDNKDTYARVKKSSDGRKVNFEFNRVNKELLDEIERLIKMKITKSN